MTARRLLALPAFILLASSTLMGRTPASADSLADKTLIVWAAPGNLEQRGGSALTVDNRDGAFDGIVYGEIEPRRWMAGSDLFSRTCREQIRWKAESTPPGLFVQIAIVYRGREISIYRNGELYGHFSIESAPLSFAPHPLAVFGRRHLSAGDPEHSFTGRIADARIYNRALDRRAIAAMRPGLPSGELIPWAWWPFCRDGLGERTGRFTQIRILGNARIEQGSLFLGGNGASVIYGSDDEPATSSVTMTPIPGYWSSSGPVPPEAVRSSRLLRERLLADPYRPRYHFCVPDDNGMPGDPNGAFYAQGRYHLMYLYNRTGSGFCWGHVSSSDLVHWRNHPDAIGPGDGDDGCFSGGAFVDDDGNAYLTYWMLWGARGIGMARSNDQAYERWTKFNNNPVIRSTEWGITEDEENTGGRRIVGSADPSNIWKKDGRYFMLTGNLLVLNKYGRTQDSPPEMQGDRLYLFESDNLKDWRYRHIFYDRNPSWTDRSEDDMCPSFLPLPSGPDGGMPSGKHLLLFISHNKGCQYYVGDYRNDRFSPLNHGRMTWVDNTYFAPEALVDGKGRQIMWAWLTDNPPGEDQKGWSGVYGLPRTLWLGEDSTLRMAPVGELESLRSHEQAWRDTLLDPGCSQELAGISGDACEIQLTIMPDAGSRSGLKVRVSADDKEATLIYYDAARSELVFDATRSGVAGRMIVERAPLPLTPGEPLRLRVYVDRSVVEVYANDRQAIGRRVYPSDPASTGVLFFSERGASRFSGIRAWRMEPANPF